MEDIKTFDEDEAVKFIRRTLTDEANARLTDDDILYVIDCIWDWYERNGYLAVNAEVTDEEELDVDKLVAYVKKELSRAHETLMVPDDVYPIVNAELQYEESIEEF